MIRPASTNDTAAIKKIAVDTDMFDADGATFVDHVITGILDRTLDDHRFVVWDGEDGAVAGAAYFAPEPFSDRMWNLYFIAVHPDQQGNGIGGALLDHVEDQLRLAGPERAQVLIVETSSTDQYAGTRKFYPKHGYVEEARIRRFYGPHDNKVIYWKALDT